MKFAIDPTFWKGRRIFLTGHTGFKGAWLLAWLHQMGARVWGYALPAEPAPSVFAALDGAGLCDTHVEADLRDQAALREALLQSRAEVVFHLAAQPLVRQSYHSPAETFDTNVMGTVALLDACRACPQVRAVVVVTTDKCYENREWAWSYRENDPLGGHDPYSASKAAAEIVVAAYRQSFFSKVSGPFVATARAGNVFGGGDWSDDRLVPDAARAFAAKGALTIRNPDAIRPWQFVLEPLAGYLMLARACIEKGQEYARSYNFGPSPSQLVPVADLAGRFAAAWGDNARCEIGPSDPGAPHEAGLLLLDAGLANRALGWVPQLDLDAALAATADWYRAVGSGHDMRKLTLAQIRTFSSLCE